MKDILVTAVIGFIIVLSMILMFRPFMVMGGFP